MKNPFNAMLTPAEQKLFGFLGLFLVTGMFLYYSGITEAKSSRTDNGLAELSQAVEKDSVIRIDIRTAGKDELVLLPGIGEKRAEDIIAYRQSRQFESPEELLNIKGIGAKTFLAMKPMLLQFGVAGKGVSDSKDLDELKALNTSSANASAQNKKQALDGTGNNINKEQTISSRQAEDKTQGVNLNSASLDELMSLDGIGEVKAKAILEYRKQIGKFTSLEQLLEVKGIGPKTLEKNRSRLSL